MNQQQSSISILTSAIGLGVYIPALLINHQLRSQGLAAEVLVLEEFYREDSKRQFKDHQCAFRENFALALLAQRMTKDVQSSLESAKVESLLRTWQDEKRTKFIVWSGFWIPIIEQYRSRVRPQRIDVHHCRIDAEVSASFRSYPRHKDDSEIWLWNWESKRLHYQITVNGRSPLPFSQRSNRLIVHGGGWAIGTYQSKIPELQGHGIPLDILVREPNQVKPQAEDNRYFMVDLNWDPWCRREDNQYQFPPFAEIGTMEQADYRCRDEYHDLFDVIGQCKAIVSKPGGGTLIDSLASATPIVLLEPYGSCERKNAQIWEHLGFGVSYARWRDTGFSFNVLEQLHKNLLNHPQTTDYVQAYANSKILNT